MKLKRGEWRLDGSERYYRQGDTVVDSQSGLSVRPLRSCETTGPDGSLVCNYLNSARLLFGLATQKAARVDSLIGGATKGFATELDPIQEVRLGVVCLACKERRLWYEAGLNSWIVPLLSKNLERLKKGGTSITWQWELRPYDLETQSVFSAWPMFRTNWKSALEQLAHFGAIRPGS